MTGTRRADWIAIALLALATLVITLWPNSRHAETRGWRYIVTGGVNIADQDESWFFDRPVSGYVRIGGMSAVYTSDL